MMEIEIPNANWKELFDSQKAFHSKLPEQNNLIDSYFFIFDCLSNEIIFMNSAFDTVTGYDSKTFHVNDLIEIIHPEDQPYFFQCEETGVNFTNNLSFNEHYQYILSYTYRIKTENDKYIYIQQQCQAIEVNNHGNLSKTLVMHKRIDPYNERPTNDYKIFDKGKNIYIDAANCYNLSKRELEILNFIKEGKSSIEIADHLNISKYTVDTHRKNILKKTNSTTFIDLIRKISFLS